MKHNNLLIIKTQKHTCGKAALYRAALLFTGAEACFNGIACPKGFDDGVLTAQEVMFLSFKNTVVILSACETAKGQEQNGGEVKSLSNAFMYGAGAKYVIRSLHKIDDKVSRWFMKSFYKFWLIQKNTLKKAFQLAKNEIRPEYPSPYYWGAFVLVGR